MKRLQVNVRTLKPHEIAAHFNRPKMSQGEQAARLYLGNKQIERAIKADRIILIVYGLFSIGALASPFIIFWGV